MRYLLLIVLFLYLANPVLHADDRADAKASVKSLSLVDLGTLLDKDDQRDAALLEFVRRGGRGPEHLLARVVEKQAENRKAKALGKARPYTVDSFGNTWLGIVDHVDCNLEILAALRRVQKKRDPLLIEVHLARDPVAWDEFNDLELSAPGQRRTPVQILADDESELRCYPAWQTMYREMFEGREFYQAVKAWGNFFDAMDEFEGDLENLRKKIQADQRRLKLEPLAVETTLPPVLEAPIDRIPPFVASFKVNDVEGASVGVNLTADWRNGRKSRWRFEVSDSHGKPVPIRRAMKHTFHPWHRMWTWFDAGRSWKTLLDLNEYVNLPGPGEYTVTLQYHNLETIAIISDPSELDRFVTFRSATFKLRVLPHSRRTITLQAGDRRQAESLIRELPGQGHVKFVPVVYSSKSNWFLEPQSPAAQLMKMHWQAVPSLISALADRRLTRHQKAWILCILFTTTREHSLSPKSDHLQAPVLPDHDIQNGLPPECSTMGMSGHSVDLAEQDKLFAAWREFAKQNLEIQETAESGGLLEKP